MRYIVPICFVEVLFLTCRPQDKNFKQSWDSEAVGVDVAEDIVVDGAVGVEAGAVDGVAGDLDGADDGAGVAGVLDGEAGAVGVAGVDGVAGAASILPRLGPYLALAWLLPPRRPSLPIKMEILNSPFSSIKTRTCVFFLFSPFVCVRRSTVFSTEKRKKKNKPGRLMVEM